MFFDKMYTYYVNYSCHNLAGTTQWYSTNHLDLDASAQKGTGGRGYIRFGSRVYTITMHVTQKGPSKSAHETTATAAGAQFLSTSVSLESDLHTWFAHCQNRY